MLDTLYTCIRQHSSFLKSFFFLILAYNVNTAKPSVTAIRPSTIGLSTTTLIPPTTMKSTTRNTDSTSPVLITVRPDTSTTTTTSFQSLQTTITNNDFQTTPKPDDVSESTFITSDTAATFPVSVPSLIDILTGNSENNTADTITNTTTPLQTSVPDFPTFPNFPLATENDKKITVVRSLKILYLSHLIVSSEKSNFLSWLNFKYFY